MNSNSNSNHQEALVVLSGGQDSVTCLFWAQKKFAKVHAVGFDYGQRHKAELECAAAICGEQNIPFEIINAGIINQLTENALTRTEIAVEKFSPSSPISSSISAAENSPPNTFVEGRNLFFLSFAAVIAKSKGIRYIITGVGEADYSGYPDCRDIFVKSLNASLNLAMDCTFVIETPLMGLTKAQTWALAEELCILPLIKAKTITCYNGIIGSGCGECPACVLRRKGYEEFCRNFCQKVKPHLD